MTATHQLSPAQDLLLLDLDGTVIDIAPLPGAVVVDRRLQWALGELSAQDPFGVVIVTGRALSDADHLLAPLRLPALASHGAEIRVAGTAADGTGALSMRYLKPALEDAVAAFVRDGAILEWKPYSAAVHVRAAPHLAQGVGDALLSFIARHRTYRIQTGRHVFEILPSTVSKRTAVARLMQHLPYKGRRPIYIGDDRADHDAMQFVEQAGGIAMRVAGEYFALDEAQFGSASEVRDWVIARAQALSTRTMAGTAPGSSRCISE